MKFTGTKFANGVVKSIEKLESGQLSVTLTKDGAEITVRSSFFLACFFLGSSPHLI